MEVFDDGPALALRVKQSYCEQNMLSLDDDSDLHLQKV